ncbi:hypothetical protein SDC9_121169 [bioreactor metagenome]|uniref:Uncharacterized protein n=1 Tax=bioreactor metagenome TaxID=1076179 RepID=A0A645CB78_9ZZZZ
MFFCIGIENSVRHIFYDLVAQTKNIVHGLAIGDGEAGVVVGTHKILTHDSRECLNIAFGKRYWEIKRYVIKADILRIGLEICVG